METAFHMQTRGDADASTSAASPSTSARCTATRTFARSCLLARRLVEAGVRFVTVYYTTGDNQPWDTHTNHDADHRKLCADSDQAAGALIADLKQRGMLDDTLVIWGGEFGRTPYAENRKEATTRQARRPRPSPHRLLDAPRRRRRQGRHRLRRDRRIRHARRRKPRPRPRPARHDPAPLGLDHEKLTYRYAGRDFRLTDVSRQRRPRHRCMSGQKIENLWGTRDNHVCWIGTSVKHTIARKRPRGSSSRAARTRPRSAGALKKTIRIRIHLPCALSRPIGDWVDSESFGVNVQGCPVGEKLLQQPNEIHFRNRRRGEFPGQRADGGRRSARCSRIAGSKSRCKSSIPTSTSIPAR